MGRLYATNSEGGINGEGVRVRRTSIAGSPQAAQLIMLWESGLPAALPALLVSLAYGTSAVGRPGL